MITERPLCELISVETPDYDAIDGFVLDVSQLGDDDLGSGTATELPWEAWECDAVEVSGDRGAKRSGLSTTLELGMFTVTLKNAGDPLEGSPLRPNMLLRVSARADEESDYKPVFTGALGDLASRYKWNRGKLDTYVTLTAVDNVRVHRATTRYGALPSSGYETLEERLARLSSSSRAPINPPSLDEPTVKYGF